MEGSTETNLNSQKSSTIVQGGNQWRSCIYNVLNTAPPRNPNSTKHGPVRSKLLPELAIGEARNPVFGTSKATEPLGEAMSYLKLMMPKPLDAINFITR